MANSWFEFWLTSFFLVLISSIAPSLHAESVTNHVVQVSVSVQREPPRIDLAWTPDNPDYGYSVYRRTPGTGGWPLGIPLPKEATGFGDSNVMVGVLYEYAVFKDFPTYFGEGFVWTGIDVPLRENRGKVILLVDDTVAPSLGAELVRLRSDLIGDGWTVIRHDVLRTDSVMNIKAIIAADYQADPAHTEALFLLGHIPVPYSGNLSPDGHAEHKGAWPADLYYGDMNGTYTDTSVNNATASDPRNWNAPGDGKFDQTEVPGTVALQIGRVDCADLPALSLSEIELLRRYLNKDHRFRHGQMAMKQQGLIDDNFGVLGREAFAANGWRNFTPFFGPDNIVTSPWLSPPSNGVYLWGYGCGAGTYSSAAGVASTADLATADVQVVFTMLFGSFFGDWDSQNNLMRGQLAGPNESLSCAWAGRPHWYFHHMGLGETIGFSTRASENGAYGFLESPGLYEVHVALMGDPTLRMHVVKPASGLVIATNNPSGPILTWVASRDPVLGYHVYRAPTASGPFARLNAELLTTTHFVDTNTASGPSQRCVYMVRAVKLEVTPSGSYYNASQGSFEDLAGSFGPPRLTIQISIGGSVRIGWPAAASGYRLQSAARPDDDRWWDVTNAVEVADPIQTVKLDTVSSNCFFRLRATNAPLGAAGAAAAAAAAVAH